MDEEVSATERLMTTLISKMESMDSDLQSLKRENAMLRKAVNDPTALLRKAGFVATMTPLSEDVETDMFRSDEGVLLKANDSFTNEEIHLMSWEEIHDMADQAKTTEV
jgi:hypothetical protein|tara:strand:- start:113 stop:436 length:324 start_codon:yes stop_codon:yes gene_type:complete